MRFRGWLPVVTLMLVAPAAARAAELPDLQVVPPYKVQVVERDGEYFLGFASAAENAGSGTLRVVGAGPGDGTMTARQLGDDGGVLKGDVGALHYVAAYGHRHWHYMGFMRYELRGLETPGLLADRKQGFCLADSPFVVGWCARDQPGLRATELGIRPGGIDIYEPNVEGQEIRIDPETAPSGRYVITARIDPAGVLRETRTDNNVASTVIDLRWPTAGSRQLPSLLSCVGEGCAGQPPDPRPRRISATTARRLARKALRRALRGEPLAILRVSCRRAGPGSRTCRVLARRGTASFQGRVRLLGVLDGAATRWRYRVNVLRRCEGARDCTRRIRRRGWIGPPAQATALVCRAARR